MDSRHGLGIFGGKHKANQPFSRKRIIKNEESCTAMRFYRLFPEYSMASPLPNP